MTLANSSAPLIAFEGIDGSGKGTQATRLHARLIEHGIRSELFSFPRYQSTFFGSRIGEFLNGEFGDLNELDPFLISLLYAGDRFESRERLLQARAQNEAVVLDRYIPSNLAHQSAKKSGDARSRLQEWIQQVEYGIFALPRPNLVVLLDVPVDVSQELIQRKQKRSYTDLVTDLQESDMSYLEQVREIYLELAESSDDWVAVSIVQDGQLRSIEEIGTEIWDLVRCRLPFPQAHPAAR